MVRGELSFLSCYDVILILQLDTKACVASATKNLFPDPTDIGAHHDACFS